MLQIGRKMLDFRLRNAAGDNGGPGRSLKWGEILFMVNGDTSLLGATTYCKLRLREFTSRDENGLGQVLQRFMRLVEGWLIHA
jgi:hypothetical protein